MPPILRDIDDIIVKFVSVLNSRNVDGSGAIALATIELFEKIITDKQYSSALELLSAVRAAGKRLTQALPQEGVVGNMVRRVLRAIRDEHHAQAAEAGAASGTGVESLQGLVRAEGSGRRATLGPGAGDVRTPTLEHLAELKLELETSAESIAEQAAEHVHADELILTFGASRLVERFLRRAAATRPYRLILAEGSDTRKCHIMARSLANAGVSVTVVGDSAVMAVMSRVNKVVISAQSVLAGGALRAGVGAHALALAARHYRVPVIVLAPLYKMCPVHVCEQVDFNTFTSPERTLPYECTPGNDISGGNSVHVYAPLYDYVPPDLVTLFVTNQGGSSPSYIYRLLSELYDPRDYQL